MSESASIAKLGIRHDAILHFMLANPTVPKGEVAQRFNVSPAWLSTIINSEAFLEARALYTDLAFHESVLPMREKLVIAADKALDRMIALTELETDLDKVRKTAETTLAACGFGTMKGPTAPGVQINIGVGNASPAVVMRAKEMIGARPAASPVMIEQKVEQV